MNTDTNAATTNATDTFKLTIWVSKQKAFLEKIKHLNRILASHGKSPITHQFTNYRMQEVEFTYHFKGEAYSNDGHRTRYVEVCDVICTGHTLIKKEDKEYVYLGTVNFTHGIKQVFCNNEKYARYFTEDFREHYCDHCHSVRTNRKNYYLFLEPQSGDVLQIGSSCVREYFGIASDAFLKCYGETFILCYTGEEEDFGYDKGTECFGYAEIAPALSYCTNGFLVWNKASVGTGSDVPWENATKSAVVDYLLSVRSMPTNDNFIAISLDEVIDFWTKKYEKDGSTFSYNCRETLRAGYATERSMGAFCYGVFAAYHAKMEAIRAAEAAKREYVPCAYAENTRQTIMGVVTNIREFVDEGFQGLFYRAPEITKYIVDFTEDNGTLYHFTTAGGTFSQISVGDRIEMRCTIGETKPYKGVPYTRVSRPKATLVTHAA